MASGKGLTPLETAAPYIIESDEFRVFLTQKRTGALRVIEDLDAEIARYAAELNARQIRRRDLSEIVACCDAALAIEPLKAE